MKKVKIKEDCREGDLAHMFFTTESETQIPWPGFYNEQSHGDDKGIKVVVDSLLKGYNLLETEFKGEIKTKQKNQPGTNYTQLGRVQGTEVYEL